MPFDWQKLLELAPLAMMKPGSIEGAAMLRGYQESMQRRQQQQMQAHGQQRQDELARMQMENMQADNARADAQLQNSQAMQALNRVAAYRHEDQGTLGALDKTPETALAPDATPLSAQNDLTVQRLGAQQDYGVPAGTPQGPLPNMTQAVSNRDKRLAQQVLDRIDKHPMYAGYHGKPELEELNVQFKGGQTKKVRELRAMAGGMLLGPDGQPVAPMAPQPRPRMEPAPGSFGEYVDAPPDRKAAIRAAKREFDASNDKAQTRPTDEAGWATHTITDPTTNTTRMVRVNSRTGEVQPIELPAGTQPGGQRSGRLSASQQDDLATMATISDLANQTLALGDKLNWSGVGGMGVGGMKQFAAKNLGRGTMEEQSLRNNIGQILGTIAKLRGGTSFTPNEQRLLETYTPTINDNSLMLKSKLASLQQFIGLKRKNMMAVAGGGSVPPLADKQADPMGIR